MPEFDEDARPARALKAGEHASGQGFIGVPTFKSRDKQFTGMPSFTLDGNDRHAPELIELWALVRELEGEQPEAVAHARQVARHMRMYRCGQSETTDAPRPSTTPLSYGTRMLIAMREQLRKVSSMDMFGQMK
jgi:hypothetical protein